MGALLDNTCNLISFLIIYFPSILYFSSIHNNVKNTIFSVCTNFISVVFIYNIYLNYIFYDKNIK